MPAIDPIDIASGGAIHGALTIPPEAARHKFPGSPGNSAAGQSPLQKMQLKSVTCAVIPVAGLPGILFPVTGNYFARTGNCRELPPSPVISHPGRFSDSRTRYAV